MALKKIVLSEVTRSKKTTTFCLAPKRLTGVIRSKKKNRKKSSFWNLLATVTILKWQTVLSVNKFRRENKTKQTKAFIL